MSDILQLTLETDSFTLTQVSSENIPNIQRITMKLQIGFVIILCFTFTLTACDGSVTPAPALNSKPTNESETAVLLSAATTSTPATTLVPTDIATTKPVATSMPATTSGPNTPPPTKLQPFSDSPYVGLWQFPTTKVWVKITAEGKAFQCRVAPDGLVYQSKGILTEDNKITWDRMWGVETITRVDDTIVLNGKYGEASYLLTIFEMDDVCRSPY